MIRAGYCNAYKWNRLKCDEYIRNVGQVCAEVIVDMWTAHVQIVSEGFHICIKGVWI